MNTYGMPGLVDMPTADVLPDAELGATFSFYKDHGLNTLTFQMAPWVTGAFRYTKIVNYDQNGTLDRYDRSFDLHFRLLEETDTRPAVALGMRDFIGTGIYEGEYLALTKGLGPRIKVTGGIGWGRLGSRSAFTNPLSKLSSGLDTRDQFSAFGGTANTGNWFSGPAAFFGGIEVRPTDRLSFRFEHSSDAYLPEVQQNVLTTITNPMNAAVTYRLGEATDVGLFYVHGRELGLFVNMTLNPKRPPNGLSNDPGPPPIVRRPAPSTDPMAWSQDWAARPGIDAVLRDGLQTQLAAQGLRLDSLAVTPTGVRLRVENQGYDLLPQALGRTARVLAGSLPASVETFDIVLVKSGMPVTEARILRSDLEELQFQPDAAWRSFARTKLSDPSGRLAPSETLVPGQYPAFRWGLGPYADVRLFDPNNPFRFNVGAELSAGADLLPGLTVSGSLRKVVFGNTNERILTAPSAIQPVRTDILRYEEEGDPRIETLTASYQFRPGKDLYGRVTGGLLESMYAGLSTEMLWKPRDSRFGLGLEVNYVRQREFDQMFDFRAYETVTGHASAYYALSNDVHVQLDAGRYLAEDWGATLSIDREFDNGWKIGAFATLTDVPFQDFGEGSFDKGLRFSAPLSWFIGQPQTREINLTLRPILRDGGARVNVQDRLYQAVRDYHDPELQKQWGRFWR